MNHQENKSATGLVIIVAGLIFGLIYFLCKTM